MSELKLSDVQYMALERFFEVSEVFNTDDEVDCALSAAVLDDRGDGAFGIEFNIDPSNFARGPEGCSELVCYRNDDSWVSVYSLEAGDGLFLFSMSAGEYVDDNFDAYFQDDMIFVPSMKHPSALIFMGNEAKTAIEGAISSLRSSAEILGLIGKTLPVEWIEADLMKKVDAQLEASV